MTAGAASPIAAGDGLRVADVDVLEPGAVLFCLAEVLALPGREVVQDGHVVAARDQGVDEIRADEAGSACNQ